MIDNVLNNMPPKKEPYGKITHAGMLLLGNSDYDYLFQSAPSIMWRLYGADGIDKDYEIFKIPFINVVDKVFAKVRNLTYRYMPNQLTLFPMETEQYSSWLIRELLWDKLPDALSEKQKENKIRNLLYSLKQKQIIETDSTNQQKSNWILKK